MVIRYRIIEVPDSYLFGNGICYRVQRFVGFGRIGFWVTLVTRSSLFQAEDRLSILAAGAKGPQVIKEIEVRI